MILSPDGSKVEVGTKYHIHVNDQPKKNGMRKTISLPQRQYLE